MSLIVNGNNETLPSMYVEDDVTILRGVIAGVLDPTLSPLVVLIRTFDYYSATGVIAGQDLTDAIRLIVDYSFVFTNITENKLEEYKTIVSNPVNPTYGYKVAVTLNCSSGADTMEGTSYTLADPFIAEDDDGASMQSISYLLIGVVSLVSLFSMI